MQSRISRFNLAIRIQRLVQEKDRMKDRKLMKENENQHGAIDQEMDDTFLYIRPLHGTYLTSTWNMVGLSKLECKVQAWHHTAQLCPTLELGANSKSC